MANPIVIESALEIWISMANEIHRFQQISHQKGSQMEEQPSSTPETDQAGLSKITLRPFYPSDADDFMAFAGDDKVTHFCTWNTFTSKDQAADFIQTKAIPHPWSRAICFGTKVIGYISVTPGSGLGQNRAELGYALGSEYWGRGIGTAAVEMAVAVVFRRWPELERVEAVVDVENLGSQRVLEKAGFVREGVLRKYVFLKGRSRDLVMFSFLSTDLLRS